MEIHERIKLLRNSLGMTQEEFGKQLGVSRDVIGNIEYDRLKRPEQKEPIYQLICERFDIREEWLKTGEGPMHLPPTRSEVIADFMTDLLKEDDTSFKKNLIEALAKLDVKDWEDLEKLAKKLTTKKD